MPNNVPRPSGYNPERRGILFSQLFSSRPISRALEETFESSVRMGSDQIANSVHHVPEFVRDLEEAGIEPSTADAVNRTKTGRIEIPVPFPFPPPSDAAQFAKDLKEAGVEVEPDAVQEEQIAGEPESAVEKTQFQESQTFEEFAQRYSTVFAKHAPRDPDLRDFRKQVIAAFKHLGLDTNKFFGV